MLLSFVSVKMMLLLVAGFLALCGQIRSNLVTFTVPRVHFVQENMDWSFFQDLDTLHQAIRLRHAAPEVVLNVTLANAARQRAVVRAWYENEPPSKDESSASIEDIGESVHLSADPEVILSATKIMNDWYTKEEEHYDYNNPQVNENNKNFLQLVSQTTLEYGCGQVQSVGENGASGIYTVCLYSPRYIPGNESENIQKPLFNFENDQFDFSMTSDLKVGLISRLEGGGAHRGEK